MAKSEIPMDFLKADLSNPYFTHHSDHPGLVLISKSLNGDNYSAWKRAMILALNSKNNLGFVNGSIKAPSEEIDPEGYATWSRCNDMVHSWIVNTFNPEIVDNVIYYSTAHEVWEDLCERFSQSNAPRIFEIQRDIACLRQKQLSVSAYYTKFAIRGQILLMNPLPSVRQAYSSVSQEEKQRLLTSTNAAAESTASAAMAVRSNDKSSATWKDGIDRSNTGRMEPTDHPSSSQNFWVNWSSQGQDGRPFFDQDRRRMGSGRGRPQCSYCGDMGHWVQKCFQLHGYPPDHPKARMNLGSNSNWNKRFSAANQVSEADEGKPAVALSEAQLKQLFSLLNNQDENSSSKVNADLATRRTIGLGKQRDGLYYLVALATEKSLTNHSSSTNQPTCNLAISSTDLWHSRLGYVSPSRLSFIAKNFLNFSVQSNNACPICPLAKQSRLPFGTSAISSKKPFEIIHCDIWGRYRHPFLFGAHYFLTIVDDYTRFTWIFLMRHKDEAQSLLKRLFSYVFTQFESRIKTFRSDNGIEFTSLRSFFQDNGVIFQHSCVYTPQQNEVVERKHRHILQVARALKFHAQVPTQFWGECALTAVHIINRLPSPVLSFKTPFELLYSKPPSYSHLRVFGCLAYATNVHTSHKFDYRSMPSIFIGYLVGQKAYKLFDLSTKKVFTSRDVKFHEDIFPYVSLKPNFTLPSLTHNSGPIPLVAHDISSSLDSTSHALSPILSNHTSTPSPTIENDDFSSPSRPSELIIEPSSQIDPNPSPPPSTTLVSPSPVPPFASIPSTPLAKTPIFSPETHSPKPTTPLRRSSRHIVPPIKLHDYVCSHISSNQSSSLIPGPTKGYLFPHRQDHIFRCLLALAAARGWSLHQMDVNNAFLHGDLHEEIYMSPPLGLRRQEEENLVCRLHKSLYGLKQASCQWFAKFSEAIQSTGYAQSRADYSLFTRKQGKSFTALLIYVDDILITGNDPVSIATTKKFLHSHFHLKDLGDLKYFLGIEVSTSKNGIFISQRKYALEIIEDAGLLGTAPIDTPMERGLKLSDKSDLL
ncbi:hypothetical protein VitviT2T_013901 [Vitis vinifera]|uniref:Integrase catalytic domain-containing protein n=1 Tax=Vitis vinifera TaxID=29760 RepID=A0ABY9CKL1_VITVI|nr:hypothetical protein VitviT2T_013901 [Vitis vinifera]